MLNLVRYVIEETSTMMPCEYFIPSLMILLSLYSKPNDVFVCQYCAKDYRSNNSLCNAVRYAIGRQDETLPPFNRRRRWGIHVSSHNNHAIKLTDPNREFIPADERKHNIRW